MHRSGKDLLAHAALAGEQHVRLTRRDARDELFDLTHPPADRHRPELFLRGAQLPLQHFLFLAQLRRLPRESLLIERACAEAQQFLDGVRL